MKTPIFPNAFENSRFDLFSPVLIMHFLCSFCIVPVLFGSNVLLYDDFGGTSLNREIWYETNSGGFYDTKSFNNGAMTIYVLGNARHNNIRSREDRFNFHKNPMSVEVEIVEFPEPEPWSTASFLWSSLWFNLGAADSARNARLLSAAEKGFTFALNWRPPTDEVLQNIFIGGDNNTIGENTLLSGVPTKVVFSVDSEAYSITLEGATFIEGPFAGTNTMHGNHNLEDYEHEEYKLMIGLQSRGNDQPMISATIGSVTVLGELAGEDFARTDWAGFPIIDGSWVDTGEWMGMLYIALHPWVFSERVQRWIYLPEGNIREDHSGAWIHMDSY